MRNRKNSGIVGLALTCLVIGQIFVGIGLGDITSGNVTDKDTDITILVKGKDTKINVDTVADFNYVNKYGDWRPNNWGGNFGVIYNKTLGGCCTQSRDINTYLDCFGASLRLDYNVTKSFAGWYTKFQWSPTEYDKDLSDYEEFHFWVRGDPVNGCTSTFKVEFKDDDTIGEYIVDGVNTSWQEIIINLSYDVSPQPDWRKIDEFTIVFEDSRVTEKKGTLYVDDIQFIDTGNHYNTDDEFLDFVAEKAFMYFWETAQTYENTNQTSYGLIPDTTGNVGYATYDRKSSIAGNGFGLTALCIGAEKGWISKSEAEERVYKTLLSHRNIQLKQSENSSLWGTYGFFYHFLDIHPDNKKENYGQREGKTEVSSIDTALFIAGVITAGEYFGYNESIKNLAEEIYSAVQWNKFFNTSLNQFYMGWKPEYANNYTIPAPDGGYFTYNNSTKWNGTWDTYTDEVLLICLLAAGAPNESYRVPINNSFYSFDRRSWENYSYITYPYPEGTKIISSWTGSLFNYFFAHCWWDFRNKEDLKNVNWWNNSVNAALANKCYCNNELKNKFQTYNDANCWGVTACAGSCSYLGKEAKPCWCCDASCPISGQPTDEGTLAPYGAISCMPFFSSDESENPAFQSLKHYVEKSDQKLWNQYGLVDSFNLGTKSFCVDDWYAPGYLAIAVGPLLIGIHNYRAMNDSNISSTYDWFMDNTHIKRVDDATFNKIRTIDTDTPLKEINYYPRDYAWEKFWLQWPQAKFQMDTDLDRIQALGANTVRIFLHPSAFGYPQPTSEYLNYLDEVLALIDAHGLKAHVNLFDCWWSWQDLNGSQTWLKAIVEPHRNDPRIALWELQNEVPLDLVQDDKRVVRDWVQVMFPYLKQQAGNTPCTISVNDVEWLDDIRVLTSPNTPDIYSLHWYPNDLNGTKPFPSVIDRARQLIGQADLLLGEFGGSTYTVSETTQANLYRDVLYYAHQKDIVHLGVWTLNDFPQGTVQCAGYVPPPAEWYFGLYRLDGSLKPAASILQSAFHGSPPPNLSPVIVLNPSFEDINPNSGQMDNWRPWDQNWSGQQTFTQDCTVAHSGQCSVRVNRSGSMIGAVGLYTSPSLLVDPERCYSLQGYVRTENLEGWARIVFAWFDSDAQWLDADTSSQLITDQNLSQWMLVNVREAVPPINAAYFQVYAQMYSDTAASYVWFDDITMLVTPTQNFDTGYGTYPSIMGTHKGEITPNKTIIVHKMYTYPCTGTGGHTEYVRFYGNGLNVTKTCNGYIGDYHNIFFDPPITLEANIPYNYEIRTGSYPQIIHEQSLPTPNGTINCTQFTDANGKIYYDWIPAIRLE